MKLNRILLSLFSVAGLTLLAAGPAAAATATANITVTASVANNCSVSAATIPFGPVTPGAAVAITTNTITVTCNKGASITSLLLDDGANGSGGVKRMTNGTDFLSYNIDVPNNAALSTCPAAGTSEWNATTAPSGPNLTGLFTASGGPKTIALCASIPALQYPSAGSYTDTVTATLTYN